VMHRAREKLQGAADLTPGRPALAFCARLPEIWKFGFTPR
jgi:hypothetical protein